MAFEIARIQGLMRVAENVLVVNLWFLMISVPIF